MIFEQLERIRKEPIPVRRRYVTVFSFLFTGFLVLVWFTSITVRSTLEVETVSSTESFTPIPPSTEPGLWSQAKEHFTQLLTFSSSTEGSAQQALGEEAVKTGFKNTFTPNAGGRRSLSGEEGDGGTDVPYATTSPEDAVYATPTPSLPEGEGQGEAVQSGEVPQEG